jgi:hypothetical protein
MVVKFIISGELVQMIIQNIQLLELQNLKENLQVMIIVYFMHKIYHFQQNIGLTGLLKLLEEKKEVIIIKNQNRIFILSPQLF